MWLVTELTLEIVFPSTCHPKRHQLASEQEEIQRQVDRMLQTGVIIPSSSAWASPIVLAPKKDGLSRSCVDFRLLNAVTKKDRYPLSRIDDSLIYFRGGGCNGSLVLLICKSGTGKYL